MVRDSGALLAAAFSVAPVLPAVAQPCNCCCPPGQTGVCREDDREALVCDSGLRGLAGSFGVVDPYSRRPLRTLENRGPIEHAPQESESSVIVSLSEAAMHMP